VNVMNRLLLVLALVALTVNGAWAQSSPQKTGNLVFLQQSVTTAAPTVGDSRLIYFASDVKSFNARVSGAGAVTATVILQSSHDGSVWETRNTFSLSGTNADSATWETANNAPYWRTSVTAISGTGATVNTSVAGRK